MDINKEIEIKQIELLISNLNCLRNINMGIVVVLTGGVIGLFYNLSTLNIILLVIGIVLDAYYFFKSRKNSKKINSLIKKVGELKC